MPKSIDTSSEFDFSNETLHQQQPSNASVSSHSSKEQPNLSVAVAAAAAVVAASNCKKYRHQNYHKNIYIGTKNAEKWDKVRSVLSFKNDVEFVSYLLRLAEIDLADNNGERTAAKVPSLSLPGKGSAVPKKGSHEKFTTDTDTDQESMPGSTFKGALDAVDNAGSLSSSLKNLERESKGAKKIKRVQFQDGHTPGVGDSPPPTGLPSRPNRPVTPTLIPGIPILAAARLLESASEFRRESLDDDEVLDCRIAEKIKTELKEYNMGRCEGKNLSLLRDTAENLAAQNDEIRESVKRDTKEEEEDEDDLSRNMADSGIEFDKALCLAAAIKQTSEPTLERPLKRKGRPPTKAKLKPTDLGAPRKRGPPKHALRKTLSHEIQPTDLTAKLEAESGESENDLSDYEEEQFHNNSENSMDSENGTIRNECSYCDETHGPENCPIRQSNNFMRDLIEKFRWMEENKEILDKIKPEIEAVTAEDDEVGDLLEEDNPDEDLNDASSEEDESTMDIKAEEAIVHAQLLKRKEEEEQLPSYCDATIPEQLQVVKSEIIGSKVIARTMIPKYVKLGPLVGHVIHVKDIPDDCTMKDIYEVRDEHKSYFISMSNKNDSNWLRYVRPAPTRDQRNVVLVWLGQAEGNISEVYFITSKDIGEGCELFYWSDHMNSAWGRKKIDKMNCGGCNLKFEHPLYYRTHCSVFHDTGFSLTIRKYHCKVCGLAVLGKDNIMQHAAEMHDGKGAYQCQFCKKYFLRLNYLEMHRTYGCSANPLRARPLCDFCGRKFCQPQKLKVHIKRMHSADMADVLRDFQCKLCSKLLGSRAALQRHSKEVHSRNSAVVSCPRCQKLFQNRSNLKIHMLTHSGVRPFKCAEGGCSAAFTTKQCLQFHYKKVHGYTQEQMPKIERSIAYTFDAYSGGMKVDFLAEQLPRRRRKGPDNSKSLMQNFASAINERKRAKANDSDNSIGDLCKNEPNLSLLSSKISSLLSQELKHAKKLKKKMLDTIINNPDSNSENNLDGGMFKNKSSGSGGSGVLSEENLNSFKMRLFQTAAAANPQMNHRGENDMDEDEDDQSRDSILGNTPNSAQINLVETFLNNSSNANHMGIEAHNSLQMLQNQLSEQTHNPFNPANMTAENNFNINAIVRNKEFITPNSASILTSGLIQSKGSKKWMDDQASNGNNDHSSLHQNINQQPGYSSGNLLPVNRDFLSRLINNGGSGGQQGSKFSNSCAVDNEDESSILDVVDNQNAHNKNVHLSNQIGANEQHQQFGNSVSFQEQLSHLSSLSSLSQMPHGTGQYAHHHNSLASYGSTFCNNESAGGELSGSNEDMGLGVNVGDSNTDIGRIVGSASTGNGAVTGNATASLLVEAALNSVTNMIGGSADQVGDCGGGGGELAKDRLNSRQEGGMNVDSLSTHESLIINPVMPTENLENTHLANNDELETSMRNDSGSYNDDMQKIENEVKLMKTLNNFQSNNHSAQQGPSSVGGGRRDNMQFPMSQQSSSSSTNGNQNAMNNRNADLMHENDIDVDNASTPRTLDRDSASFRNYPPNTTPSPRDISPGQDYTQSQRSNELQQQQQQQLFGVQSPTMSRNNSYLHINDHMGATPSPVSVSNINQHNPSPPILPRYGFSLNDICRKREYSQSHQSSILSQQHQVRRDNHLSSDEDSIMAQNLSINHGANDTSDQKIKVNSSHSMENYNKYAGQMNSTGTEIPDSRLKYNPNDNAATNMELVDHFHRLAPPPHGQNNPSHGTSNDQMNEIGLDMSSRISGYSHHNFQLSAAAGLNRYHHHIYDILSEREQQQPPNQQTHLQNEHQMQLQQEQHMILAQQQQEHSHQMNEQSSGGGLAGNPDGDGSDQKTSVDLSRTTSYVVTSPTSLPYAPHSDMLRMVSMELSGANGNNAVNPGNMIGANNHRTFLTGSSAQHNSRMDAMESLHHHHHHRLLTSAEQHRLLASNTAAAADQLTNPAANRLLVDPAHILMDSNNRSLLSANADTSRLLGDGVSHRHMVQSRDFGSYHHHHQVAAANNYHHGAVHHPLARPSAQPNHHSVGATNYPFPTYY